MIVEEITEENFKEKNEEGEKRVDEKIKILERQIKNNNINLFLFYDPTIWAYKFLKDKQGNPLRLRGFQDKIINDKHQEIIIGASNQIGKTVTAEVKAIHHALHVPNASVLIISASEDQSIRVLDEIKQLLSTGRIGFNPCIGNIENRTELHIKNIDGKGVSIIRCLPPTKVVRGYYATLLICDEIGFWEIDRDTQTSYYNKVIYSRILDTMHWKNPHFTMGQIFSISNPNAQQGALWYLWNSKRTNKYRYCFLAAPDNTIEHYNALKNDPDISSDEFDSVYAATFSSASGGFITQPEFNDATKEEYSVFPPPNEMISLGADFAGEDTVSRDVDETVLFGGQRIREEKIEKVKIVHTFAPPLRSKKQVVYDEIKRLKNISNFAYDKAGVGDSVKNDLIDQNLLAEYQIESLTYSLPNKSEVYYNMKRLFEQRRLKIPNIPKLKEQLMGLRFEKTEGGHIKVHHAREGLHDDWADALANCCWATLRSSSIPVEATFVEHKKEIKSKKKGKLIFCKDCDDYHYENEEHLTTI